MIEQAENWFLERGWSPFPFQKEVWTAYANGESGLIHSPTGTGKTLAAWMGPLVSEAKADAQPGLKVLWITPLRALAADTLESLKYPAATLAPDWQIAMRTGDTTSSERNKQSKQMPDALVTTPESLSLMLSREDSPKLLAGVQAVIIDEWHELLSSKRGVQTELALARLKKFSPGLRVWGISATLGDLDEAMRVLLGPRTKGRLVSGDLKKEIQIDTLFPDEIERFPWTGHLGLHMVPKVIEAVEEAGSTLIFTNTRSQCELWYQSILDVRPDWAGQIAPHHGSMDREEREAVELGLKTGRLRAVVCTSSLDLGVDFTPVDRVLQVASPKGVARLLQRAGRSGHRPGVPSRVTIVPTHSLELIDAAAARVAGLAKRLESRMGLDCPLDVLAQHLVTIGIGTGFKRDEIFEEVRQTHAYRNLTLEELDWCLEFVERGGKSLRNYPDYHKLTPDSNGVYRCEDRDLATRHRLMIGTIVSELNVPIVFGSGKQLGTVEEGFVARLKKGDCFVFSGKLLEFVRMKDAAAVVQIAKKKKGNVPRWAGGRMPLSSELSQAIREQLALAKDGVFEEEEMQRMVPLLRIQADWSALPAMDEILVEQVRSREGYHAFLYPFEGRLVHEGMASLFAFRISRKMPITLSLACNDYGFELQSVDPIPIREMIEDGLFSTESLTDDILDSLNSSELARRKFREIARIAGLIFQGYPGKNKTAKQVQASSGLLYDVFAEFDKENLLLFQARKEVLQQQLEEARLVQSLERMQRSKLLLTQPPKPTPFAFPILVDRLRDEMSSESALDRVRKMSLAEPD